jgi:hypothetical protein
MVKIGDHIGFIAVAQTNIDGNANNWHHYSFGRESEEGLPLPIKFAWRPTYSVDWIKWDHKIAWFTLEEFDEVFPLDFPLCDFGWPTDIIYEETDSNFAFAISKVKDESETL